MASVSGLTAKQEQVRAEINQEAVVRLHREAEELWPLSSVEAYDKALTARAEIILTGMYYDMLDAGNSEHVETEWEPDSGAVWEIDENGKRHPPSRAALMHYAPRDEWERRDSALLPNQQAELREELRQELEKTVIFLVRKAKTRMSQAKVAGAGQKGASATARRQRANKIYATIDQALRAIAEAAPRSHQEVLQMLDDRKVPRPLRFPTSWMASFQANSKDARSWLSKRWKRNGLPPFPRGKSVLP